MKILFFAFIMVIVVCGSSYAISEAEFQNLYKSSHVLQEADKLLNQTWNEVSNNIPKEERKTLLGFQREWIKTGREEAAQEYLQDGYSKACAYAIATIRWVKNLRVMEYNYNLSKEDQEKGAVKADDAFWDEDNDIPDECRKK